jgi:hypothetical protein
MKKPLTEEQKQLKRESAKLYRENNKEKLAQKQKEYRETNEESIKEYSKNYIKSNKEKLLLKQQLYRKNNKNIVNSKRNEYEKNRKDTDPLYKLRKSLSSSFLKIIKRNGYSKKIKTHKILGCTYEFFKEYLESKFEPWMTWENRGLYNGELNHGWDIDHIIPISNAKTEDDVIRLNHYTNLQPLCSKINRDIKRCN